MLQIAVPATFVVPPLRTTATVLIHTVAPYTVEQSVMLLPRVEAE
jgi:hypothetical protein